MSIEQLSNNSNLLVIRSILINIMSLYDLYPDENYLKSLTYSQLKESIYVLNELYKPENDRFEYYVKKSMKLLPKNEFITLNNYMKINGETKCISNKQNKYRIIDVYKTSLNRQCFLKDLFVSLEVSLTMHTPNILETFVYDLVEKIHIIPSISIFKNMNSQQHKKYSNEFIHSLHLLADKDFFTKIATIIYSLNTYFKNSLLEINDSNSYKMLIYNQPCLRLNGNAYASSATHAIIRNNDENVHKIYSSYNNKNYLSKISECFLGLLLKLKHFELYLDEIDLRSVIIILETNSDNENIKKFLQNEKDLIQFNEKINYYELCRKYNIFSDMAYNIDNNLFD